MRKPQNKKAKNFRNKQFASGTCRNKKKAYPHKYKPKNPFKYETETGKRLQVTP